MKSNRQTYPTQKELQEKFVYCSSGQLKRKTNGKPIGHLEYCTNTGFYRRRVCFTRQQCYLSVLIFIFHYGYRPEQVDHIDQNPLNDKIENLRGVSVSENCHNKRVYKNNGTGVAGVHYCETKRKYIARISIQNTRIHLGHFKSFSVAVNARRKAEKKYRKEKI